MATPSERQARIQWIYSARSREELATRYDAWAEDYELDMAAYGNRVPAVAAGAVCRHVKPADGVVLDARGAGTMGEILYALGYGNVEALDFSRGMLDVARRKGVYTQFHRMTLGEPLDLSSGHYIAVTAVSVMTAGHAPPESLTELVRVTKPGGKIVFSVRAEDEEFTQAREALERDGRWRLVETTRAFQPLPLAQPDIYTVVCVYEATGSAIRRM